MTPCKLSAIPARKSTKGTAMRALVLASFAVISLSACGGQSGLHDLSSGTDGPDEFSVLPTAPLFIPQNLSVLPQPTPGGTNPTDPNPKGDAIAALGGRPSAAFAGGIPSGDAALVAYAARNGTAADIRRTLANEDAAFRASRSRFGGFNLFGGDRYFKAYANQALDAYAALTQFRNLGVTTPTAPPPQ